MNIDLDNLSLAELRDLNKRVSKAIDGYEDRMKKEALAKLEKQAAEMGFSLSDLLGGQPRKSVSKVAPKYVNPDNSEQTWTGRGRQPKWVEAHLASGKSLDGLLIK
ncbi:H-NS histone family protein [Roseobacter sp. HKCCA2468]|uniref:H-NS histone family protein n=1 Tax=Roseobacter sp. HKCCA2468 TaxID=3120342 RepID=UPI0030EDB152